MHEDDRQRLAEHMRYRLLAVRKEKDNLLYKLYQLEAREEELADTFRRAFPDTEFEPPPSTWEDLSDRERVTLHFLARRGHVRRVAEVIQGYRLETGDDVSDVGFRMRLSRLREKRVVERGFHGWSVAPHIFAVALNPPKQPVVVETDPGAALKRLAARAKAAEANARRARFKGRGKTSAGPAKPPAA